MSDSLCDFEDSKQPQGPESREAKATGPLVKVDPEHFKDRPSNDHWVESVEWGREKGDRAQGVEPNRHFEDEGTKEHELGIHCKQKLCENPQSLCLAPFFNQPLTSQCGFSGQDGTIQG